MKVTESKVRKGKGVPAILPREPLTRKAVAAIQEYVTIKARDLPILSFVVRFTLEAERMRRSSLYAWLDERGYRWCAEDDVWRKRGE